ncbi:MAG: hypothetical protein GXY33_01765 [Phycisphaerae bacterium]|nr:hypothetical protein [Phycisphaerae bacterium]
MPDQITVAGRTFTPIPARLIDGTLRFRRLFEHVPGGSPQAYAFCQFSVSEPLRFVLSIDADWGFVLWLDGRQIAESRSGNGGPVGYFPTRVTVAVEPGRHVLCCRHISGSGDWLLNLRIDPAGPTGRRSYLESGLRLEERPLPTGEIAGMPTEVFERTAATCGVEARWISVFDQRELRLTGNVLYKSAYLPTGEGFDPAYEERLIQWVRTIHDLGSPAISWASMSQNRQGWLDHPEWRQIFLVDQAPDDTHRDFNVCINTGYGDALISACIEAIDKFDLDGFWFDGSAYSSVWCRPMPISCICESCSAKYRQETGNKPPSEYRPETLEFRRWMAWRYRTFSAYWQRLELAIHAAHPQAVIAINHYHREHIPWNGAVPLNPFDANIISATEADGDPWKAAFYTRINRAYGRAHSETWITSGVGRYRLDGVPRHNPYPLITQAVSCLTAGADSSFGGVDLSVSAAAYVELSAEIRARKPYRYLPSYPLAALHVSQQTDTYTFGTDPGFITRDWHDHYWKSLVGWHRLLMSAGLWMDVAFDAHLTPENLKRYRYLFMPLAVALADAQIEAVLDYVRRGGTLITGPWFATQDEWGFARRRSGEVSRLFPYGQSFPAFDALPECLTAGSSSAAAEQRLGQGRILQFAVDHGTAFRSNPTADRVRMLADCLGRAAGGVPVCLEDSEGDQAYAHLGVSLDSDGDIIVAIQQLEPFWTQAAQGRERPPLATRHRLRVFLSVVAADCLIPEPGFPLDVNDVATAKLIPLPPYTWGTVIRLRTKEPTPT